MFMQDLLKSVSAAAAAFAMTIGLAGAASAATCPVPTAVTFSTACNGPIAGNDHDVYVGGPNVNVNDIDNIALNGPDMGLFDVTNWSEESRINVPALSDGILSLTLTVGTDGRSGTWSVSSWAGIGQAMLVVKGSNSFIAYLLDITAGLTGIWSTAGLVNNGGNQPGLSHLTLYTTPGAIVPPVPVPAAGLLLLGALGGLAALRRRRKLA